MLAVSACDWATFRHDNAHAGFMPLSVGPANPTASSTASFTVTTGGPVFSSAAIVNGVVYVGSLDSFLYAFDASRPRRTAAGAPVSCNAALDGRDSDPASRSLRRPTVAGGIVYVGSDDNFVYAFDANGNTELLRHAEDVRLRSSPLTRRAQCGRRRPSRTACSIIGSLHDTLEVFDANGITNCSGVPKVCAPLWTGTAPGILGEQLSVPAVANGLVYVGARDGTLYAFDAAGVTGCAWHAQGVRAGVDRADSRSAPGCAPHRRSRTASSTSARTTAR